MTRHYQKLATVEQIQHGKCFTASPLPASLKKAKQDLRQARLLLSEFARTSDSRKYYKNIDSSHCRGHFMARTPGATNRSPREIKKDGIFSIKLAKLKEKNAALKKENAALKKAKKK